MKRIMALLLLIPMAGCAGFDNNYEEVVGQEMIQPTSCGCQSPAPGQVSATSGSVPTVSQLPSIQTREPEMGPVRR